MSRKKPAQAIECEEPSQLRLAVGMAEEEVGARLRQQRLKRKISVAEAALALKLSATTLEEIERGDLGRHESLYRRGYVRNYARFLGLDPAPLLALLREGDLPALRTVLPVQQRGRNFERALKIATYTIVTTLIIPPIVLIYIQGGLDFLDRDRSLGQTPEPALSSAQIEIPLIGPELPAEVAREREASLMGPVTASALPLNYIRQVRDPVAASQPEAQVAANPDAVEVIDPGSLLVIELRDDSWLEVYSADGRRLEFDLLRAGTERRFQAEGPFRILAGRGSAISLSLDGQPIEFEGQERADVVSLELSPEGVVRRR